MGVRKLDGCEISIEAVKLACNTYYRNKRDCFLESCERYPIYRMDDYHPSRAPIYTDSSLVVVDSQPRGKMSDAAIVMIKEGTHRV